MEFGSISLRVDTAFTTLCMHEAIFAMLIIPSNECRYRLKVNTSPVLASPPVEHRDGLLAYELEEPSMDQPKVQLE